MNKVMSFALNPKSIKYPNKNGDNEVEKTIRDTVIDLIAPRCFVPYISDHVEVNRTLDVPFVIAIKIKKITGDNANLKSRENKNPSIIGIK